MEERNMPHKILLFTFLIWLELCFGLPRPPITTVEEDPAVTNLRTYLRFESAHPNPRSGYVQCVEWLREQASEIGLDFHFVDFEDPHDFALWMSWNGTNPSLQSILLNSHMDVVNADPTKWSHPPYEAYKDPEGNIIARGASDMKSATVAELEAIRRLKESGFQPLRTIHMMVMPDEEVSGTRGIVPFLKTDDFKNLNVGVDIDEGFSSDSDTILVTYAEKSIWQFNYSATGEAGHASNFPQYTAGQRLQVVIDKIMEFREQEYARLDNPNVTTEELTSVNLVRLGGGIGNNVIPNEVWASFDMRVFIRPGWNFTDAENMLINVAEQARLGSSPNDVTLNFIQQSLLSKRTAIDDSNIWWVELQNTCRELNVTCKPTVLTAATDGRYIRELDIPVFGFSPFLNTPSTAHQDDEFINEFEFLHAIDRYAALIRNFASVPENQHF